MPKTLILSVLLFPRLALPLFAADPDPFILTDYLNRSWSNECIEFPLSAAQAADIASGKTLVGPDSQPIPFQVTTGAAPRVSFLVNLAPFETRAYRFTNATPTVQTDLVVEETSERIRLSNGQTGISIRKALQTGQGPIENIRLRSGSWVGGSRLAATPTVMGYTVQVVSQGPVFVEALCRTEFGDGSRWELRLRLNARESVVLIDETMTLGGKSGILSLSLSDDFAPDKVFYRDGKNAIGQNIVSDIQPGNVFILEPWLRWWVQPAEGPVFSVYKDSGTDLLAVGAGEAGVWVDPTMPGEDRAAPYVAAVQDGQGLHLDFMLRNGKRKWMVMSLDKATCLAAMEGPSWPYITPLPHLLVIKHGQFPLNTVKDYQVEWSGDFTNYPRLFLTRAQAEAYRAAVTNLSYFENQIPGFLADPTPLNQHTIGGRIQAYMATGSQALEQKLTDQAVEMLQQSVETFLTQPDVPFGSAPHSHWGQFMGATPQLIDAILGGASITPEQRRRILAQLAFIGYTINRPDYWSPERGYAGNPNMTTSVLGYRMAYACIIPSHPQAREWTDNAVAGLSEQLFGWSDSNGGWLEAPHYAMVSYDPILASFLMAYRAGMNETVFDPQMKKVINWFSKISTPPDSRAQNRRHLPPVGNTYIGEPTGEFGLLAFIWKDRDPAFAAEMQWMFRRQGSWPWAGLGGSYPGFAGYREMMMDPALPETAPQFESELFPNVGVMLRSGFPSERETQMLMLAGSFGGWRSHWDDDSGSITFWGKGRIIADDFGYYGAAPIEDHSVLDAPEIQLNKIFNVTTFAPSAYLDYVSGARGPWQRQVAFVKDPDPMAPQFFVVADTYADNSANDVYDARTGTHTTLPFPGPPPPPGTLFLITER